MLITRFNGKNFPLVRYEITDTAIVRDGFAVDGAESHLGAAFRRIVAVLGRVDVSFAYDNNVQVSPLAFRTVLLRFDDIVEYQVQQTPRGAHILLIVKETMDQVGLIQQLTKKLQSAGLEAPIVTCQVVDELPRHKETNKLRRFVPLC